MNTANASRSAEAYVESLLLRAGWNVWRPLLDDGVDMIATRGDSQLRLQVKSTERIQRNGSFRFDLRKKDALGARRKRSWQSVDFFVFVSGRSHVWAIPSCDCECSAIALRTGCNGYWSDIFTEAVA